MKVSFWVSFLAVARKEFLVVLRNRGLLTATVITQLFQMAMCGFIDVSAHDLPLVIVDQDRTSYSRELSRKLSATRIFRVKYVTHTPTEARALIRSGRASVAIVIPSDYHEKVVRRSGATVLAMVDGSDSSSTGQAMGAIDGLMETMNVRTEREEIREGTPRVSASRLVLFNAQARTSYFLLPGLLSILLVNYAFFASTSLLREREMGTMERLVMTPLSPTGLVLGKVVPFWTLGFINQVVLLLAMRWIFDVPIRGDLVLLLAGTALYLVTILAIGIFFSSKAQSSYTVGPKVQLLFLVGVFLSGYIWPLSSVPTPLLAISYAHPTTHMVAILRGISIRDAQFFDLAPHFAYLIIAPIALIALTVRRFESTIQT